ncbi:MAG: hypothetical protein A2428_09850 [Bdellovibrionales bacterium RIFOXYC1_FULL_54_43]|nr:MAG: hypothetical protein A2428_09850 [Bdellovibrionales bacterium RIFOXYC1_FULL_54_43]OFZ82357.1 MAG: hypothetical protein A2603_03775 [Bdellovibrionales bacterium RIFOXYD1_FULL_55_31]
MTEWMNYRGQWGGKIASGEEMWWTEPDYRLRRNAWARFWFRVDVRQHFLLRFWKKAGVVKPGRVIDYGCGSGGTTLNFAAVLGQTITGYDIFPTQLQIAREFSEHPELKDLNCRFELLGERGRIPVPDASVDVIFSLDVLGHVPHIPDTLQAFSTALRPGGSVVLFTESTYSPDDRSLAARLAAEGFDMTDAVPEHVSLFPREKLEQFFTEAGFDVLERYSANVGHFLFFPKDYVLMFRRSQGGMSASIRKWKLFASLWNALSRIAPFYPWPFQVLRLGLTHLFGRQAYGTGYFYHLRKK